MGCNKALCRRSLFPDDESNYFSDFFPNTTSRSNTTLLKCLQICPLDCVSKRQVKPFAHANKVPVHLVGGNVHEHKGQFSSTSPVWISPGELSGDAQDNNSKGSLTSRQTFQRRFSLQALRSPASFRLKTHAATHTHADPHTDPNAHRHGPTNMHAHSAVA